MSASIPSDKTSPLINYLNDPLYEKNLWHPINELSGSAERAETIIFKTLFEDFESAYRSGNHRAYCTLLRTLKGRQISSMGELNALASVVCQALQREDRWMMQALSTALLRTPGGINALISWLDQRDTLKVLQAVPDSVWEHLDPEVVAQQFQRTEAPIKRALFQVSLARFSPKQLSPFFESAFHIATCWSDRALLSLLLESDRAFTNLSPETFLGALEEALRPQEPDFRMALRLIPNYNMPKLPDHYSISTLEVRVTDLSEVAEALLQCDWFTQNVSERWIKDMLTQAIEEKNSEFVSRLVRCANISFLEEYEFQPLLAAAQSSSIEIRTIFRGLENDRTKR